MIFNGAVRPSFASTSKVCGTSTLRNHIVVRVPTCVAVSTGIWAVAVPVELVVAQVIVLGARRSSRPPVHYKVHLSLRARWQETRGREKFR